MINHVRNRLVNLFPFEAYVSGRPGDEYVPPDFVPLPDDHPLWQPLSDYFYPNDCDATVRSLYSRVVLTILHDCGYGHWIKMPDSRITYLPWNLDWYTASLRGFYQPGPIHIRVAHLQPDSFHVCSTIVVETDSSGKVHIFEGEKKTTLTPSYSGGYSEYFPVGQTLQAEISVPESIFRHQFYLCRPFTPLLDWKSWAGQIVAVIDQLLAFLPSKIYDSLIDLIKEYQSHNSNLMKACLGLLLWAFMVDQVETV